MEANDRGRGFRETCLAFWANDSAKTPHIGRVRQTSEYTNIFLPGEMLISNLSPKTRYLY